MNHLSLKIETNQDLTPNADKSIFWLELSTDNSMDYQPGDWALISGKNSLELVIKVLKSLSISETDLVEFPRIGNLPAGKLLQEKLEISQLNPAILNKLQRQFQIALGLWPDRASMMDYAKGKDVLDLLESMPEVAKLGAQFLPLLSPLAPRYYSIASSGPKKLSLLYRRVEYLTNGRVHYGAVSNWLAKQPAGEVLKVEIKANPTFKLPAGKNVPIVMIASGTGLAPFLGFMEQRIADGEFDNWLFFGETHPENACLQCEQLKAWQADSFLTLNLAFSRVEPKAYVQDALQQTREQLWDKWQQGAIVYLCGSQQKMAVGVQAFWQALFAEKLSLCESEAADFWQQMRTQKRIQMDVY